jgi:glycosyltransferase involved in cell wall biosynthesis
VNTVPLVTLGVPVRNGAETLATALDSIVAQDHPNIEVVISDNASTDGTQAIIADFAARYPFIRVIRQAEPLTAIENFMVVMREARGEFFAWCAHDDTRSPDFVSRLLDMFSDPATVLAFGDLYIWDGRSPPRLRADYDFANESLSRIRRLQKAANMQCYHIYGLWRLVALRAIRYRYAHWWSDLPLILAAASIGTFRYVAGPRFIYLEVVKSPQARAAYQDNRPGVGRLANFAALYCSILLTVGRTGGMWSAVAALYFVNQKYMREAFSRIAHRVRGCA